MNRQTCNETKERGPHSGSLDGHPTNLCKRLAAFLHVAVTASRHAVAPGELPTFAYRHHMVDSQMLSRTAVPATAHINAHRRVLADQSERATLGLVAFSCQIVACTCLVLQVAASHQAQLNAPQLGCQHGLGRHARPQTVHGCRSQASLASVPNCLLSIATLLATQT